MDPIEALRIRGIGGGKKPTGNALPADVRVGKTFSTAAGYDLSGTMPVQSTVAQTVTPTTLNITKQAGIYDGDITIQGDANLVGANIVSGKTIFGVAGGFNGKQFASGTAVADGSRYVTVSGLTFRPTHIIVQYSLTNLSVYDGTMFPNDFTQVSSATSVTATAIDGTTTYVNNGSFKLRVASASFSYNWYAYE